MPYQLQQNCLYQYLIIWDSMMETRLDNLPPSFLTQSKILTKILQKLSKQLANDQHPEEYNKKNVQMYLNTFAFEAGFNPPTQHELSTICSYLQDSSQKCITKTKFQALIKKCLHLYTDSKKQPLGGVMDRLILMLRNDSFREKEKQINCKF